ncbi:hypothetical protein FGG08_000201 [Glutinoglossum americanum]|uniref:gamma-glutamylcyclotransferase n=1 Tax=Glutinoglossum americanum TaxID=1670608 RepID=A0A9P8L1M6_9PEZI|nr:hypothetical protein FGG08_000201 [Glutinoglossum americanum]
MSSQSPSRPSIIQQEQYYFAYGSNLRLDQMARRCPGSKYIGRASLLDYLWQINERGYANIVKSEGDWVEGLVYELSGEDEKRLDRNEGVAGECYSKEYKSLQLYRASEVLHCRPVPWIVKKGGPAKVLLDAQQVGESVEEQKETTEHDVLVYISSRYVTEGDPWEEYIERINLGVADAADLGVSEGFIQRFIRPYIPPAKQVPAKHTAYRPQQEADVNGRRLKSAPGARPAENTAESHPSRSVPLEEALE